jgi:hypothetical protein
MQRPWDHALTVENTLRLGRPVRSNACIKKQQQGQQLMAGMFASHGWRLNPCMASGSREKHGWPKHGQFVLWLAVSPGGLPWLTCTRITPKARTNLRTWQSLRVPSQCQRFDKFRVAAAPLGLHLASTISNKRKKYCLYRVAIYTKLDLHYTPIRRLFRSLP